MDARPCTHAPDSDDVRVAGFLQQEGHLPEVVARPEPQQLHLPLRLGLAALDAALLEEVEGVACLVVVGGGGEGE